MRGTVLMCLSYRLKNYYTDLAEKLHTCPSKQKEALRKTFFFKPLPFSTPVSIILILIDEILFDADVQNNRIIYCLFQIMSFARTLLWGEFFVLLISFVDVLFQNTYF